MISRPVNFIVRGPHPSFYANIMMSIVNPIRLHLAESVVTENALENAVNVHFFHEMKYQVIVPLDKGINVFLSHGIADKSWRDAPAMIPFDYVCVSGPLWKEKLIDGGVPPERILETGFSKLDPLFQGVIKKNPGLDGRKVVLYAPTHSRAFRRCSSYPCLVELLAGFPDDLQVVFSPHPVHKDNQMPTIQELADADLVISDSSSLLYEAWALNKPVVFPDWLVKDGILDIWPQSFTARIYREEIGYHAKNIGELLEMVYCGLKEGIDARARAFVDQYLPPSYRGKSGQICASHLRKLAGYQPVPVKPGSSGV